MCASKSSASEPIVIVGAGPAGVMAAISASDQAASVLLLNKNPWPGKKISAIPADEFFVSEKLPCRRFAAAFNDKSQFVLPIFKAFGYADLVRLFKKHQLKLDADERGHLRANGLAPRSLMENLLAVAVRKGVVYKKSCRVTDVVAEQGMATGVILNGTKVPAAAVIMATGSFASPKCKSTRDGYTISEKLGHRINKLKPALVDLITDKKIGKLFANEVVPDVIVNTFLSAGDGSASGRNEELLCSDRGEIKFSGNALSGQVILNRSAQILDHMADGKVELRLDFMPDRPRDGIEIWFTEQIDHDRRMTVGQFLTPYFSENLSKAIEAESRVSLDKSLVHVTNLERKSLLRAIKDFRLKVTGAKPFNFTGGVLGGVDIANIDPETCASKIIKSLFFAGAVMDVLGPWGGFNMQFAISSGYVAGTAAASGLN